MRFRSLLVTLVAVPSLVAAQSQYYNLDAGRPGRIEDAGVTALYALGIDIAPFEYQRLSGGTTRLRAEPKLTYGLLPFTDIELRFPLVEIIPPRSASGLFASGLAGVAVGSMHAFNLESPHVPAFAAGTEISLPVGSLAAPQAGFIAKIVATKSTSLGRVHFNAGAGSYSVRISRPTLDSSCASSSFDPSCASASPPIITDSPCDVDPDTPRRVSTTPSTDVVVIPSARAAVVPDSVASIVASPRTTGARWFAGIGIDRAVPLASVVMTADLFTETFHGLYAIPEWTAELGLRHQLAPMVVVDVGVGRRFAGIVRATTFTLGLSWELATPPVGAR